MGRTQGKGVSCEWDWPGWASFGRWEVHSRRGGAQCGEHRGQMGCWPTVPLTGKVHTRYLSPQLLNDQNSHQQVVSQGLWPFEVVLRTLVGFCKLTVFTGGSHALPQLCSVLLKLPTCGWNTSSFIECADGVSVYTSLDVKYSFFQPQKEAARQHEE